MMNTDEIMQLALTLSGLTEIPGDSAVYNPGTDIRRILIGIDIDAHAASLAKEHGYDLAISHHPMGDMATINFHHVLDRHVRQMTSAGVPLGVATDAIARVIEEKRIINSMRNYDHAPSIARMLDIAYMNVHTPLDEIGRKRMADAASSLSPDDTVADLIEHFQNTFGEFRHALTAIEPFLGSADNRLGRVVVSHGAGTNGGYRVAKAYFDHGIDTVIYIHCLPPDITKLREEYPQGKNLIVTGHIASDSVGINPFIAALRAKGIEVTAISGIIPG